MFVCVLVDFNFCDVINCYIHFVLYTWIYVCLLVSVHVYVLMLELYELYDCEKFDTLVSDVNSNELCIT